MCQYLVIASAMLHAVLIFSELILWLMLQGVAQHRQQIHSKLVNIMRERLSTSLKALHATSTSWAAYNPGTTPLNGAATPRNTPNDTPQNPTEVARADSLRAASPTLKPRTVAKMMLQIARQVTTLHEALAPVMSRSQQAEIGMRVRRMYSEALARYALCCAAAMPVIFSGQYNSLIQLAQLTPTLLIGKLQWGF